EPRLAHSQAADRIHPAQRHARPPPRKLDSRGCAVRRRSGRDRLSRFSRGEHGYFVTGLPSADDEEVAGEGKEALRHPGPGPDEDAITRTDWEAFLRTLTPKERSLAQGLESGLNLSEIAEQRGTSKAAVADMRQTLVRKWDAFDSGNRER